MNILKVTFLFLISSLPLLAQETAIYTQPYRDFKKAQEHYNEGNYSLAQQYFEKTLDLPNYSFTDEMELAKVQSLYYQAICALKLEQPNAEMLLTRFIDEQNNPYYEGLAHYQLGKIYFDKKQYRNVISAYEDIDLASLSEAERSEVQFQLGYSYFSSKKFDKAKEYLSKGINTRNDYYYPSNYYYGMISFFEGDYDDALLSFRKVEKEKTYSQAIPYYITYIYYSKGQYSELLQYAEPKTSQNIKYRNEINQLVGQTYFNQQQFTKALPYLQYYFENTPQVRKDVIYQLAYTQYQVGQYEDAITNFTELNTLKDSIGQNAMYHLAATHLKVDQKTKALNAFDQASRLDFDPVIKEISTFNHAKLSYELGFHSTASARFRYFIANYPNSQYYNEATQLLASLFENTQDYQSALEWLESIPNKTPALARSYQRALYYRGVEYFSDKNFAQATELFNKSLQNPYDEVVVALAHFWKGDIAFRQNQYPDAFGSMEAFIGTSQGRVVSDKVNPATANYTIGYSLFNQKEYGDAKTYFENTVNLLAKKPDILLDQNSVLAQVYPDAILRTGDCYFIKKEYAAALAQYDKILQYKLRGADYAYYQKGMLSGLMGQYKQKIDQLTSMTNNFSTSYYVDDALFQIAETHLLMNNPQAAINTHKQLLTKQPDSEYVPKSLLNLGLIYYNTGDYTNSLKYYEEVLKKYPKSDEGQGAILGIKDVFIAKGDAAGYVQFLKRFPGININPSAQDTLTFRIAENYYTKGDCNSAVKEFTKYLAEYPNGSYQLYAYFYRGQCLYSQESYQLAGKDYDYILAQPRSIFTEQALDKGSRIALYINDDYAKAFKYYEQLYAITSRKELAVNAIRGLVKSAHKLGRLADVVKYGDLLRKHENATAEDKLDSYFAVGELAYQNKQYPLAVTNLDEVVKRTTNEQGAKARYYIADIKYKNGQYDAAQEYAFKVIKETEDYEYWMVKSFILLSDVYVAKKDIFQAKATLVSVIENYAPEDELKKEARAKLNKILELEKSGSKLKSDNTGGDLEFDNQ
ncbi:MAG: tetratricopeptide repeat protein [Chitinophagales bacterium]